MDREALLFLAKVLVSATLIAGSSSLAGRHPVLAGYLIALPLTSVLALVFAQLQHGEAGRTAQFATSIMVAVPASLLFFVPFLFYGRFRGSFWLYFAAGLALLYLAYFVQQAIAARLVAS